MTLELLEAEYTVIAHNKLLILKENYLEEHGNINYDIIYNQWKEWYSQKFAPRIIKRVKENKKMNN
jgi:hypothetical protein